MLDLIKRTTSFDNTPPIAEHILLHLRHGGDKADSHLLLEQNNQVIGYAHIDQTDLVAGPSVELVVDPANRGTDIGNQILGEVIKICGKHIRLWVHGEQAATYELASANNFKKIRTVLQMSKQLQQITQTAENEHGVSIRCFLPGIDDKSWLELNNRAFKGHPEQGGWDETDLAHRLNEDWFDASGFFIAEKNNAIIGAIWTKIHGATSHDHGREQKKHDHPAIGEIYVTAVDPLFSGQGVGKRLTVTALNYLKYKGLSKAILYVDQENTAARKLYEGLGFSEFGKDILFKLS